MSNPPGPPRLTVEEIIANQIYYSGVCEEQSEIFRSNPEEYQKAYDIYVQTEDVAGKPGQTWMPSDTNRDAYILEMQERCKITPTSIYE